MTASLGKQRTSVPSVLRKFSNDLPPLASTSSARAASWSGHRTLRRWMQMAKLKPGAPCADRILGHSKPKSLRTSVCTHLARASLELANAVQTASDAVPRRKWEKAWCQAFWRTCLHTCCQTRCGVYWQACLAIVNPPRRPLLDENQYWKIQLLSFCTLGNLCKTVFLLDCVIEFDGSIHIMSLNYFIILCVFGNKSVICEGIMSTNMSKLHDWNLTLDS